MQTGAARSGIATEFGLLALLALMWGSSYLFIKIAVSEIPPVTLIAMRVAIAALFLLVVLHWRGDKLPRDTESWKRLFIQAFLAAIGAWILLAWGQQHIDSGLASVLNSISPLFVFFITLLVTRHEAVTGLKLFGACLGLCGVILIIGVDALAGLGQQVAGQLAAVGGALLYGCAAIHGKRFSHLKPHVTATGTMTCASLVLVPLALILDKPWMLRPSFLAIAAALVLAIFCTALALLIYFRLVETLGSMGVASQAYLRAGVGVLLGVIILGEQITPVMGLGLVAAVAGVAAINMPRRKA